MIMMTTDYFLDNFTVASLQEAIRHIDRDAENHDLKWYTISDRASKMREMRANMIEALTIMKVAAVTASQAEKAGQE